MAHECVLICCACVCVWVCVCVYVNKGTVHEDLYSYPLPVVRWWSLHWFAAFQSCPHLHATPPRRSPFYPRCVVANNFWVFQLSKDCCFTHHLDLVTFPELILCSNWFRLPVVTSVQYSCLHYSLAHLLGSLMILRAYSARSTLFFTW